jgi:hypothetical protein
VGDEKCLQCFGWKPEGKRPLARPRRRWEARVGTDLREIVWEDENWIYLAQNMDQLRAIVYTIMSLRVSKKCGKFLD